MGGDIHAHGGSVGPGSDEGLPAHLKTNEGETYWEAAARKTLVDVPVRTWHGAAHKEEAARLTKKAKDLEMAVESGSITTIGKELRDLKGKVNDLENKLKGMSEDL